MGLHRRGWTANIASLTHESFFVFFSPGPQIASLDTPRAHNVIIYRSGQVPFGGLKDEI